MIEKANIDVIENDNNEILSVSIKEETEDRKLIEEVINALNNIQIGEKVDVNFNNDGRHYIIEYKE